METKELCDGCKYWSQMCAMSIGCGPMQALCLCQESPHRNKMVSDGCDHYEAGVAIDEPKRFMRQLEAGPPDRG